MYWCVRFTGLSVLCYILSSNGCFAQDAGSVTVTPSPESSSAVHGVLEYFRRVCLAIVSFVVILLVLSSVFISIFFYLDNGRVQKLRTKQRHREDDDQQHEYDEISEENTQQACRVPNMESGAQMMQAPLQVEQGHQYASDINSRSAMSNNGFVKKDEPYL